MPSSEEILKDLEELGFSKYEAKAYLSLVHEGICSAPRLSRISGVPKSKIYDTLDKLDSKGVIERFPFKPQKFKARAPRLVFEHLIKTRREELETLTERARALEKKIEGFIELGRRKITTDSLFWTVGGKRAYYDKCAELIRRAEKEILVTSPTASRHPLLDEAFVDAVERKVKLKGITSVSEENIDFVKYYLNFFELKNFKGELPLTVLIIDRKECLYKIQSKVGRKIFVIGVHSLNPGLVKAFLRYWRSLWKDSKKIEV
jgi:sugar-specific transcriptional regulator TrmB